MDEVKQSVHMEEGTLEDGEGVPETPDTLGPEPLDSVQLEVAIPEAEATPGLDMLLPSGEQAHVASALQAEATSELSRSIKDALDANEVTRVEYRKLAQQLQVLQDQLAQLEYASSATRIDQVAEGVIQQRLEDIHAQLRQALQRAEERLDQARESLIEEAEDFQLYARQLPAGGYMVIKQQAEHLQAQLDEERKANSELHDKLKEARDLCEKAEARALQLEQVEHRVTFEQLQEALRKLQAERAELEDLRILKERNALLENRIVQFEASQNQHLQALADQAELMHLRAEVQQLTRDKQELERERAMAQDARDDVKRGYRGAQERIRELNRKLAEFAAQMDHLEALNQENEALKATQSDHVKKAQQSEDAYMQERTARLDVSQQLRHALDRVEKAETYVRTQLKNEYQAEFNEFCKHFRESQEARMLPRLTQLEEDLKAVMQRAERAEAARDEARRQVIEQAQEIARLFDESTAKREALEREFAAKRVALEQELATYRQLQTREVQQEIAQVSAQCERLRAERDEYTATKERLTVSTEELEDRKTTLTVDLSGLKAEHGVMAAQVDELRRDIERLEAERNHLVNVVVPRADRMVHLVQPAIDEIRPVHEAFEPEENWLEAVESGIKSSGFIFSPRLLRAFHASLKSAAMSPLTVLAGISGTGKSELPRLYSDLGGLYYHNIAVQPNWDSPDDLFGFFNYTDGRYRATTLSRILYQLDPQLAGSSSLHGAMVLVLLDEMNLARVEYYFSELLSRLETRRNLNRGQTDWERAAIHLDLGAGEEGLSLFLDHNLLFVGTMNEDESTLTLSDKVKDRASVLTFPHPRSFASRTGQTVMSRPEALARSTWEDWLKQGESRIGETRDDLQTRISAFNEGLAHVGRAVGHRVYQAIERYLAMYPGQGGHARQDALSDAYALKLLPRLVGIEVQSRQGRKCLDLIQRGLPEDLQPAFQRAREHDFFTWEGAREIMTEV